MMTMVVNQGVCRNSWLGYRAPFSFHDNMIIRKETDLFRHILCHHRPEEPRFLTSWDFLAVRASESGRIEKGWPSMATPYMFTGWFDSRDSSATSYFTGGISPILNLDSPFIQIHYWSGWTLFLWQKIGRNRADSNHIFCFLFFLRWKCPW